MKRTKLICVITVIILHFGFLLNAQNSTFESFIWESSTPKDCPLENSSEFGAIEFTGNYKYYPAGDTWYPTWADNDTLYSPWTDGTTNGVRSRSGGFASYLGIRDWTGNVSSQSYTAQGALIGNNPLDLKVEVIGDVIAGDPYPYGGRYPAGSLIHNGVWYYGTYCLGPYAKTKYSDGKLYNWPCLGPFVGFRTSTDYGKTWTDTEHTPYDPIFNENGMSCSPIKIGSPHFVDFGKNMEHSPDGKAYLVAHGADINDLEPRFANHSWITGDLIYMLRIEPTIENINDASKYEFFAGYDKNEDAVWTSDFSKIKPIVDWNNNLGCVTITYIETLNKYIMCVTNGWPTAGKMNTFLLEADEIDGKYKLISYLEGFGEQAYFVNIPTKFLDKDEPNKMWLCYSGNFAPDWNGIKIEEKPLGSKYGLVFQEIKLLPAKDKK